ncbi:MAG: hypothetical protein M3Z05_12765 [Gemmatimonadota bacterium]|nr:hypothetical protein [Gemmatimonadota bacterium]
MRYRRLVLVAAVSTLGAGCHRAPSVDYPATADGRAPRIYDVITREELADRSQLGTTAYLAIQRLRPSYLIDKTAGAAATIHPVSVSVNGGQLTPLNTLISIPTQTIAEIRYLDMGYAAQRFHNRATGPVILVTLTAAPAR